MGKVSKYFYIVLITIYWGCSHNSKTEKYQNLRNNIEYIQDEIKEVDTKDILIGSVARLYSMGNYLIIADHKTIDRLIHIFNINNFSHITSIGNMGHGPDEITIMGHIGIDENNRKFYVSDHGKQKIFSFNLDSILSNSSYNPEVKISMNKKQFPNSYLIINDTLSIGQIIEPTSDYEFNQWMAKWNIETGKIVQMKYKHPNIKKKRINIAASKDYGLCIECYQNHDLMTILDFEGNLKCNVYGNNWNKRDESRLQHFGKVIFRNDKVIASYSGGDRLSEDYFPSKLLIFNINGDYLKTLDVGYRISDFCYDKQNDRLIFNFEDMIQFGYLELKNLFD